MEFGAHLPLILAADQPSPDAAWISDYASSAEALGYRTVSSNDHVMYRSPWLDGPTTLAVAAAATKRVSIATSVLVPAIRHPFVAAKMLATLDALSGGPSSSAWAQARTSQTMTPQPSPLKNAGSGSISASSPCARSGKEMTCLTRPARTRSLTSTCGRGRCSQTVRRFGSVAGVLQWASGE